MKTLVYLVLTLIYSLPETSCQEENVDTEDPAVRSSVLVTMVHSDPAVQDGNRSEY